MYVWEPQMKFHEGKVWKIRKKGKEKKDNITMNFIV